MLPATVADRRRRQAAIWASRHRVLGRVFGAALHAGVDLLVFKGVHLAYALYPDVAHRECADADVFPRPEHRDRFIEVLGSLGFRACETNIGDVALGQVTYELPGVPGSVLDVHSRVVTPFALSRCFGFHELWARSERLTAFPENVRVPSTLDALRIALAHQAEHHPGEQVTDWTRDVHLLVQAMNPREFAQLRMSLADGIVPPHWQPLLIRAQQRFPSERGEALSRDAIRTSDGALPRSPSIRQRLLSHARDLRSIPPGHAARIAGAHLFPSAAYMRQTYARGSRLPLVLLYLLRIVRGARRAATELSAR